MQQARQLGRYQLLDRVAFGGMAEIYRAKTADAEGRTHLVAVKRVLGHLCEDDEFIQMLVDEAKITAALQHDNIARIYEFCRTEREYFIAMEYVDGKDVRALLEKARQIQEPLPEEHVAWIGMEVARALHAAHTQRDREGRPLRIVHRDVSPSNVLLSYRGEVKLCDFGIAKATLTRVQTKTGVIKGKVKYMSPEQAMGRKLDHRSDLFSLGTLLYEMLTLQAPFQAPTEIELIFAVRDARKKPAIELRPGLHPQMEAIIDKAMARSRSQRYQSGEEQAVALEQFLGQMYPGYRRSHFSRYMRNAFTKEIDRELRLLEEYVIEGGKAEDVGENLLADVLGPDAPYTQFTAAFVEASKDVLEQPTGAKLAPGARPSQAAETRGLRGKIDAGWEADSLVAQLDDPEAPDPGIHEEQTRILTRAQVMASMPDLHEAATRIFDLRSLPKPMRDVLQPGLPDFEPASPVAPGDADPDHPGFDVAGDIHEADTAYLPRSRISGLEQAVDPAAGRPSATSRPPTAGPQAAAAPAGRPAALSTPPAANRPLAVSKPPASTGGPASRAADLNLPGVRVPRRDVAPAPPPPPASFRSGEVETSTAPGEPATVLDRGQETFSDLPTQLRGASPMQSGSVEISSNDLAFIDATHRPIDSSEPSVILRDEDLEQVD